ncbi:Thioesterase/thiol ester dehydrase-isomerase [Ramicandelaber brevisporus]|nr:Thioesterase/thiol ester dehydrase-isomerase [Ramicandelaber brevisporus]
MAFTLAHVRSFWKAAQAARGLDYTLNSSLEITKATVGRVHFRIPVEQKHLNRMGTAHGGWISNLVDDGGSMAIASMGLDLTGVSTDISTSFIAAAKPGDMLEGISTCDKLGARMAYTSTELFVGEKLVAKGSHTKYLSGAMQKETNLARPPSVNSDKEQQ